jgi:hypothetical protein
MIGHSVPTLQFGDNYDLNGGVAYRQGTWASTMRYRKSNKTWYWIGCVNFIIRLSIPHHRHLGFGRSRLRFPRAITTGLFIDDDGTMYVVHGSNDVVMFQLSADGLSEAKSQPIFSYPFEASGIEGNRMYMRNGTYYVLDDDPSGGATYIWKSTSPWGPWTYKLM